MADLLTKEEKEAIINQHIKGVQYGLYNAQLDLIEAQSVTTSDQATLDGINERIAQSNAKISALQEELSSIS